MANCNQEDCESPIAPADGKFCVAHSKKLATPHSSMMAKRTSARPRSVEVGEKGINTSSDFANFMGALMTDLVDNRVDADTANAAVNAGRALLEVVELRMRHGFKKEDVELIDNSEGIAAPKHLKLNDSQGK